MGTFEVSLTPPHPVLVPNDSQANILSLQLDIIWSLRAWAFAPMSCVQVVHVTGQVCACIYLWFVCPICLDVSCRPGSPTSNWGFPTLGLQPHRVQPGSSPSSLSLSDTDSSQPLALCSCNSLHQNALPASKSHPHSEPSSNYASSRKTSLP